MKPRVGQQLTSTVDATTVIVIRWPDADVDLTCGGREMVDPKSPAATEKVAGHPDLMGGTLLGKRYADDERGVELLCTKGGDGSVAIAGAPLRVKNSKPLPASD